MVREAFCWLLIVLLIHSFILPFLACSSR